MKLRASFLLALAVGASPAGAADRRWRAEPSGVTFELTATDLRAWVGDAKGEPAFSAAALLAGGKKQFDGYADEMARGLLAPDPPVYGDSTFEESMDLNVLSIVGPLLVYRETGYDDTPGAAHPTRYELLHVLDLGRKDAKPSLLDFFSEKQLVAALKADPWIRKFDNGEGDFKRAASLDDLVGALDQEHAREKAEEGDCAFDVSFTSDALVHQFYFHRVVGDKVAVRIFVDPGSEWCNRASGGQTIGLLLPMPASLRGDLLKAQSGEAGLLAANAKAAGAAWSQTWKVDVAELAETLRKQKK